MGEPTELLGTWSFQRLIRDLEADNASQAAGICQLSSHGADLILWRERGTLKHAGRELPATRDLRIERAGDGWLVKFEDGRFFHPWTPGEKVTHLCRADLYEGRIEISRQPETITAWRVSWRIQGPQKDLLIETELSRPAAESAQHIPLPGFEPGFPP